MKLFKITFIYLALVLFSNSWAIAQTQNPLIYADVPDMSIIRVGDVYYMSSTTMHMNPGVPIMKSTDLVNWKIVNYCYDTLADLPVTNLEDGKGEYGRGTWASCIRFHNNTYYVSTFSNTTRKTYVFSTNDIENGKWKLVKMDKSYHDHSIFFDDNGKIYIVWGSNRLMIAELKPDFSGAVEGTEKVLIEDASKPAGPNMMLGGEGSQLFKVNGKYYLFNICWPRGGMRTVIVHRADNIYGPYEGKVGFMDKGVAQGGIIDTPDGKWFAYLFQDCGAVGRVPFLLPVKWEDGWPVIGVDGKVPETLDVASQKGLIPGTVNSDEFKRKKKDADLPLVWQWNHNPDNAYWSVRSRKGYLRLTTHNIVDNVVLARNTLTQRTIGPECSGTTSIDVSNMKIGDVAGLLLLQKRFGWVGVKAEKNGKSIVMVNAESGQQQEIERIPLNADMVYLKAECNFKNRADVAKFYYSLNGKDWKMIGSQLKMAYTIPQFIGYRYGLFNYATKEAGGYVDFDYFRIADQLTEK